MKRTLSLLLVVAAVISLSLCAFAADIEQADKVIAYYFHGRFRCYICNIMEKYIQEAIEGNFKGALASGRLELKAVNVEERGNEHYVNDYRLYTRSLIVSLIKDGKEVKHKNLDKIWQHVRNKQQFTDYVVGEVSHFLKDAQ